MSVQPFVKPTSDLDRGSLGKYELLCRLSTGGMSEIFLATQKGLAGFRKIVVLKSILPDISGEDEFVKMFLEEARTTAAFNHPNIAQVFDLDTDDGTLFLAMEFVQGATLVEMARACRQAKEPIPLGFTLASVRDTALALHYAHNFTDPRGRRQVVIHRDVAEKNIMVTYEGTTKLLDFGIAKALGRRGGSLTSIGMVKGTSGYMSPEQIRGEPLDPRSDIFALGVVLHECLTGMRLFHGKSAEDGMLAALREDVAPPSRLSAEVPPALDQVTLKALARDRDQRFTTALEFAREIEKACPGQLWHPEQSGDLVQRFYTERRVQTRELIEAAQGSAEHTGEFKFDKARLQAVSNPPTPPKGAGEPGFSRAMKATSPGSPAAVRRTDAKTPSPRNTGEQRIQIPTEPVGVNVRLTRAPAQSVSPHKVEVTQIEARDSVLSPGEPAPPDDDYTGERTVPAAALPDELIAQIRASRAEAATAGQAPVQRPSNGAVAAVPVGRAITGEQTNTEPTGPSATVFDPFADGVDPADSELKTAIGQPFDTHADEVNEPAESFDEGRVEEEEPPGDPGPEPQTNTLARRPSGSGVLKFLAIGCGLAMCTLGIALYALKLPPFTAAPKPTVLNSLPGPIPDFGGRKTPPAVPVPKPAPIVVAPPTPRPVDPKPEVEQVAVETEPAPPRKKPDPPARPEKLRPVKRKAAPTAEAREAKTDAPPPSAVGSLSLVVEPPVHAFFNGRDLGLTPLKANLPVGRQSLKLVPPSGPPKNVNVEVKESGGAARFDLEDL